MVPEQLVRLPKTASQVGAEQRKRHQTPGDWLLEKRILEPQEPQQELPALRHRLPPMQILPFWEQEPRVLRVPPKQQLGLPMHLSERGLWLE